MTKKIISFLLTKEIIIVLFLLMLILSSYGPLLYHFLFPPCGKIFLGSFGFPHDFFGNLISFQEGRLGHWLHYSKISSAISSPPTLVRWEYNFLGQLSRLLPFEGIISFHLFRFLFSLILIFLILFFAFSLFPSFYLPALILAFFSAGWETKLINLWTPLGIFQRWTYYPHYLWSFVFFLAGFWFLIKALESKKINYLILGSVFNFLASNHPPVELSFYLTLPFYLLIFVFQKKPKIKEFLKECLFLFIFSASAFFFLFYLYQVRNLHPWDLLSKFDLAYDFKNYLSFEDILKGLGLVSIFAFLGSWFAVKEKKRIWWFLAPQSFIYLLGFFIVSSFIGYNSIRFFQTPFFLWLAFLTALFWQKIFPKKNFLSLLLFFLIFFLPGLPGLKFSFQTNFDNFSGSHSYIFASPLKKQALEWLKENTQEKDIILSSPINGMLIAAFAGNYPYVTVYLPEEKEFSKIWENYYNFLKQTFPINQAEEFLKKENIKYIFWGEEEKKLSEKNNLNYPFLEKVFENSLVLIFRFNPT